MICIARKTSSLTWCVLASIALHSLLLWRVGLIWNRQWPVVRQATAVCNHVVA